MPPNQLGAQGNKKGNSMLKNSEQIVSSRCREGWRRPLLAVGGIGLLTLLCVGLSQPAQAQFTEVNHALTGWATSSSDAYGSTPDRANDGNTDGNWGANSTTHTADNPFDDPAWLEIDLQAMKDIGRVQIWFRTDCCTDRNSGLQLIIYDNTMTELARRDLSNPFLQTPSQPWTAVNFAPAIKGQVVRVQRTTPGVLSLAEVQVIAPYTGATINVTQAPANASAEESRTATFGPVAATVTGAPQEKLTIQWQRNGQDISGATQPTYTTPILTMANHNDTYTAKFMVSGVSSVSSATLSVQKDTTPPTVASANAIGNKIGILFDWLMDAATCNDKANYAAAAGVTINSATLAGDGRSVVLDVSGLTGPNFNVTINNVKDLGGNAIAANTAAAGALDTSVTPSQIGTPTIAGTVYSTAPGQYVLTGGGETAFQADGDQIYMVSATVTGDFDKKARIAGLTASVAADNWARGGLIAQASKTALLGKAVTIAVANPKGANMVRIRVRTEEGTAEQGNLGWNRVGRDYTGVDNALPNQWVRMQRVGNAFFFYVGTDGQNWSLVGERYIKNMPDTLEVGVYAAASTVESAVTVNYANFSDVTTSDTTKPTLISAGTLDKKTIGVKFSEKLKSATAKLPGNYALSQGTVTAAQVGVSGESVYLTVTGLTADTFTVTVNGVQDSAGNAIAANSSVAGSVSAFKAADVGRFVDPNSRPQETDNPYDVGQFVALSSGTHVEVDCIAAGANLWNGQYFHFVYVEKTGDFDMQVEVARFTHSSGGGDYAHGGLMARDGLYLSGLDYSDAGTKAQFEMNTTYEEAGQGRTALVLACVNPGDTGEYVGNIVNSTTADTNGWLGYFGSLRAVNAKGDLDPKSSPSQNRWLRLKRVGQVFTHYWSYDGITWTEYQSRDRSSDGPLADTLLVGFAAQVNDSCCDGEAVNGKPGIYGTEIIRNLGDTAPPRPTMTLQKSGAQWSITYSGTLQSADTVDGTYTDVQGATSPYVLNTSSGTRFYRSRN